MLSSASSTPHDLRWIPDVPSEDVGRGYVCVSMSVFVCVWKEGVVILQGQQQWLPRLHSH